MRHISSVLHLHQAMHRDITHVCTTLDEVQFHERTEYVYLETRYPLLARLVEISLVLTPSRS